MGAEQSQRSSTKEGAKPESAKQEGGSFLPFYLAGGVALSMCGIAIAYEVARSKAGADHDDSDSESDGDEDAECVAALKTADAEDWEFDAEAEDGVATATP